ncbi:MAG: hypothetical protein H0U18_01095 [Pyrinomonadaceae bacterium]|nr:hypothetical protein [Pyrinomonadaceae bacterium]
MNSSGGYADNPFLAEFYDSVVPYRERQDVSFFVEMAQRSEGPVLELGCGTGRVLIPIASQESKSSDSMLHRRCSQCVERNS